MKEKLHHLSLNYKYRIFKNNLTFGNNFRLREKLQRDFPFFLHSASSNVNIYITTVLLAKLRNNYREVASFSTHVLLLLQQLIQDTTLHLFVMSP